jgi:hypothetical protein
MRLFSRVVVLGGGAFGSGFLPPAMALAAPGDKARLKTGAAGGEFEGGAGGEEAVIPPEFISQVVFGTGRMIWRKGEHTAEWLK